MTEEETFWMLAAMVERVCGGGFYDVHMRGVRDAIARFTNKALDTCVKDRERDGARERERERRESE